MPPPVPRQQPFDTETIVELTNPQPTNDELWLSNLCDTNNIGMYIRYVHCDKQKRESSIYLPAL